MRRGYGRTEQNPLLLLVVRLPYIAFHDRPVCLVLIFIREAGNQPKPFWKSVPQMKRLAHRRVVQGKLCLIVRRD